MRIQRRHSQASIETLRRKELIIALPVEINYSGLMQNFPAPAAGQVFLNRKIKQV